MGTSLVAINYALKAASIRAELVTMYAGKHEFVGPDAPKLNAVVTYTPLNTMTPDEWVDLYRARAAERMPNLSNCSALANWAPMCDIDMAGAFASWGHTVRTNGKLKREVQQEIASRCDIEPGCLLLMRPSVYKPGRDKSGGGDTHMGVFHWFLSFAYQPEIVDVLRSEPSRFFSDYTKEWAVPAKNVDQLLSKIGHHFSVVVDTEAGSAYCKIDPDRLRKSRWREAVRWLTGFMERQAVR